MGLFIRVWVFGFFVMYFMLYWWIILIILWEVVSVMMLIGIVKRFMVMKMVIVYLGVMMGFYVGRLSESFKVLV